MSGYSREHVFKWLTIVQPLITKIGILGCVCRKILINGIIIIIIIFTCMTLFPGFIPRAFSVIEVTEQVYLGVLSFSLKIQLHSKLPTSGHRGFSVRRLWKKGFCCHHRAWSRLCNLQGIYPYLGVASGHFIIKLHC